MTVAPSPVIMRTNKLLVVSTIALLGGVASANTNLDFAFDSAVLPANADQSLTALVDAAEHEPGRIVLDGHADHIGDAAYNVNLSLRRALAVREKLISMGVDRERIVISAYGEDNLAARRVSARLTTDSVASVVRRTFAGRGTAIAWETPMTVAQLAEPSTAVVAHR
jgi:outer membrane protein OmpA-like peptidoglycan-associated protein